MVVSQPHNNYKGVLLNTDCQGDQLFGLRIKSGYKDEPGVHVTDVAKGSVADADGRIIQKDVILAVNRQYLEPPIRGIDYVTMADAMLQVNVKEKFVMLFHW